MTPNSLEIVILGLVQGVAEPLPISSSAHVIAAEKLMGIDPSSPEMTFMLIMLHTGSLGAVILYFWKAWRRSFFSSAAMSRAVLTRVAVATTVTLAVGLVLKEVIERGFMHGARDAEVERLFSNLPLIATALAVTGILNLIAGLRAGAGPGGTESLASSVWIGATQGLCLPFRGLSRSGSTISAAMLLGIGKRRAEDFSFALVVVLTPGLIGIEFLRLLKAGAVETAPLHLGSLVIPALLGMACSFVAGLAALRWLTRWLDEGRWHYFGVYCFVASAGTLGLWWAGY